ncbi:MAG: hypothetical protein K9L17_08255 [Clostridiales bacterium]|nr:hypothetical protein [Clostridiales bacterium]MCF8022667.1 hypothetical protein [Clostridiales bacterium]
MRKDVVRNALDISNMAVYKEVDVDKLSNGQLYIKEGPAENAFLNYLQKNLHLNDSLEPASDSSPVSGQVDIISFEVYNSTELPATDSVGNTVNEVSVHSHIEVPLKPVFSGMFDKITIPISITTETPDELTVN